MKRYLLVFLLSSIAFGGKGQIVYNQNLLDSITKFWTVNNQTQSIKGYDFIRGASTTVDLMDSYKSSWNLVENALQIDFENKSNGSNYASLTNIYLPMDIAYMNSDGMIRTFTVPELMTIALGLPPMDLEIHGGVSIMEGIQILNLSMVEQAKQVPCH